MYSSVTFRKSACGDGAGKTIEGREALNYPNKNPFKQESRPKQKPGFPRIKKTWMKLRKVLIPGTETPLSRRANVPIEEIGGGCAPHFRFFPTRFALPGPVNEDGAPPPPTQAS